MMHIRVAKHAGFCFGVKRAVETAVQCASLGVAVYTFGEIIHNNTVVDDLKSKGVYPIMSLDGLNKLRPGDTLIIRSHGVPPDVTKRCEELCLNVLDATCPFVLRIHEIVNEASDAGKTVYIAGQAKHPEVEGICGWAKAGTVVLESEYDAKHLHIDEVRPSCIVAQTTLQRGEYKKICDALVEKCPDLSIYDTICDTTAIRQAEAVEMAKVCDTMVVIGGRRSSNTAKLAEVCKKHCKHTYSIEYPDEILLEKMNPNDIIGIVAGASTPQRMIREVVTLMSELEKTTVDTAMPSPTKYDEPDQEAVAPAVEETSVIEEVAAAALTPQAENEPDAVAEKAPEIPEKEAPVSEPVAEEASVAKDNEKPSDAESGKESFAEAFEKTMVRIRNGQVLTGTIVQIADGEVCVNIGYKSDGFIPKNEFSSDPDVVPDEVVKVGDPIEVEVLKVNDGEGNVLLSRKNVESKKLWEELIQETDEAGRVFDAVGKDVVKGGLIASINGVRAFVPASHVSIKYVENLSDFVGKPMKLSVIEVDKPRKRIVASQKNVLLAEIEAEKKQKWLMLEPNTKVSGTVRRLTDFGAFVDIGGIDGLIHVTDVSWGRIKHPSEVLKIGQQVEVLVLNVDAEKERVSLGYKQLQPKPWALAGEKYPVGSVVEGEVVRIVPFGAFVALEPSIDGLIHISQIGVKRIMKVEDEVNVGDKVRCKVLDVNTEAKRISLSRKEVILEENPEIAEQIAQERADRDRAFAERQEQRAAERQQRVARSNNNSAQAPVRQEQQYTGEKPERAERPERKPRRGEGPDYDLPPVQSTTTSLADLLQGLNMDELSESVPDGE